MSAIRDHALLALPPSFATQLPPNGGTFYCADTIDSSRPHYRRTWPSILHAAAMWLNKHPFRMEMDKITDMTNEDRLFLSIGTSLQTQGNVVIDLFILLNRFLKFVKVVFGTDHRSCRSQTLGRSILGQTSALVHTSSPHDPWYKRTNSLLSNTKCQMQTKAISRPQIPTFRCSYRGSLCSLVYPLYSNNLHLSGSFH